MKTERLYAPADCGSCWLPEAKRWPWAQTPVTGMAQGRCLWLMRPLLLAAALAARSMPQTWRMPASVWFATVASASTPPACTMPDTAGAAPMNAAAVSEAKLVSALTKMMAEL